MTQTTWAAIKPDKGRGQNAAGRVFFRVKSGVLFMSLATNQSEWDAVNMETGDLRDMNDSDPVEVVAVTLRE